MLVCDAAAGDDVLAALTESRLRTAVDRGTTTFLLPEVHVLGEVEQDAVMRLVDLRLSRPYHLLPRIISTCSVSLYDRVRQGAFDARLFHRLNIIHIVWRS
jgi:DNA-binding NtrC family response regulator